MIKRQHRPIQVISAANRGGVGKTTTAIIAYTAMMADGREPRLIEVERSHERVFERLLKSMAVTGDQILHVDLPEASTYADDPAQTRALFTKVFEVLETNEDAVVDLAAGATLELLAAAKAADHADFVRDRGANIVLLACCTADDVTSWGGAKQAVDAFRQAYPHGDAIVVICRVRGARGAEGARKVLEEQGVTRFIEVPEHTSRVMTHMYGRSGISPHKILQHYDPPNTTEESKKRLRQELQQELGSGSLAEAGLDLKAFRDWYVNVLHSFTLAVIGDPPEGPTEAPKPGAS